MKHLFSQKLLWVVTILAFTGCQKDVEFTATESSSTSESSLRRGGPPADPAITYIASSSKGPKIMVMNADGSNQAAVASPASTLGPPCWSPDGQSIVFAASVNNVWGVWIVDVSIVNGVPKGLNLRSVPLSLPASGVSSAKWAGNGKIYFIHMESYAIYSVNPDGSDFVTVYVAPEGFRVTQVDTNPDGLKIAFTETAARPTESPFSRLVVYDLVTQQITEVTSENGPGLIRGTSWSHNGDRLAFSDGLGNNEAIWTVTPTTNASPVYVLKGSFPDWSGDDSKLAFTGNGVTRYEFSNGSILRLASGSLANWKLSAN